MNEEGKSVTEVHEQRNEWLEQCEELLNKPASKNPLDIEAANTDILIRNTRLIIEEISKVIIQVRNGKKAGPDNILAESLNLHINITTK